MKATPSNKIIPAKEIISALVLTHDQKIQRFNELVRAERDKLLKKNPDDITFRVELLFAMFGNTKEDIQFVIDQGYEVYTGCLDDRWVVGLFQSRLSRLPIQPSVEPTLSIPTAAEVKLVMPSADDRRRAIFKKEVESQMTKTSPYDFLVCLSLDEFDDDKELQFIRDLGYIITKDVDSGWWAVTLPGEPY